MLENRPWGDAVVTGHGMIDGRPVAVFSQDFTVFGGSLGEVMGEKMCKVMDLAARIGCPVIGINDSGGARIQEGVVSLGAYGDVFVRNVQCSGVIPQISLIMGPCAGGAVYSPAMTDFIFMVKETSHMFITGPDVIKTVTGEEVEFEELGGAMTHNTKSGVAHFAADDEESCLEDARYLMSFLPQNNLELPPRMDTGDDPDRTDEELDTIVPGQPEQAVRHARRGAPDRRQRRVLRGAGALRAQHRRRLRAPERPADRRRRKPAAQLAGVLDIGASEKAARFVRFCDAFNIPLRHVHGRARLPARHVAGVGRDHPPRRQAPLRLHRGHGAQADRDHAQGLRRRLRRHELQAHAGRLRVRLADRRGGRDGSRGRGEHHPPARHQLVAHARRSAGRS